MADRRDLLFEIGTEELPASEFMTLGQGLERTLATALGELGIDWQDAEAFATPRRLAVRLHGVAAFQPDEREEHRGPPVSAAFDADGRPTDAAEGFARRHGIAVAALERRDTGKGEYLFHVEQRPGRATAELLPSVVNDVVRRLPAKKRMRWNASAMPFPRPVHWAVLLFGDEVVEAELLGVTTGRRTRGHRFHHPVSIELDRPADYDRRLRDPGHVIAGVSERAGIIRGQVRHAAAGVGGHADLDETLLTEVTALVEWPVALAGRFDARFLEIPPEALVAVMKDHQKYFPVHDDSGALLPVFVTVSNIDSERPEVVRAGNERVIEPRLADAEFFWNQDRRRPLAERLEGLEAMVFQRELGSLRDRSARIAHLAATLADDLGADAAIARRAGELAKCDLLTEMVGEFPELQGLMGGYYARHDGEPNAVARAIAEHYRPAFARDALPETPAGQAVALADRLDALVGIFAIGQAPSGDSDPFALRRAALGVLRILVERRLELDLTRALHAALDAYRECGTAATRERFAALAGAQASIGDVYEFVLERFKAYYTGNGYAPDLFEAVRARRPTRPLDFDARLRALCDFRDRPEAGPLAEANKRIRNILRKAESVEAQPEENLFTEPAERALAAAVDEAAAGVAPLLEGRDYEGVLARLAALAGPLDRFFDDVLVMDENPALRANRIALLGRARGLFLDVADLSYLQSG